MTEWPKCGCDLYSRGQNVTASSNEDIASSTAQTDRKLSSTADGTGAVHSRSRRCAEIEIEKVQLGSQNLHLRSRCPWTYSYNTDPNRVPRTLVEAQCSQTSVGNLAGQCEHVYYYVPVRQNVSGTWTDRWIRLRVGCTLASPITAPPITRDWPTVALRHVPDSDGSLRAGRVVLRCVASYRKTPRRNATHRRVAVGVNGPWLFSLQWKLSSFQEIGHRDVIEEVAEDSKRSETGTPCVATAINIAAHQRLCFTATVAKTEDAEVTAFCR